MGRVRDYTFGVGSCCEVRPWGSCTAGQNARNAKTKTEG